MADFIQFEKSLNRNKKETNDFIELNRQRKKKQNEKRKITEEDKRHIHDEKSCYNCKKKNKCEKFRKLIGGNKGYVSVTGKEVYYCENYTPIPKKSNEVQMSKTRIENLVKEMKRSLR